MRLLLVALFTFTCLAQDWPHVPSAIKKDPAMERRIQEILKTMTVEEKVGQLIQTEINWFKPHDFEKFPLGSVLSAGGSYPYNNRYAHLNDWVGLADQYYWGAMNAGKNIPLIWGVDAVHGHNNVVGATVFPHNIGLGAANNPELIEKIGQATAKEVLATGIDWTFAPTVAVVQNNRWGRTYESYSQNPQLVKAYAKAMVEGLQGKGDNILSEDHIVATTKHFLGDGGTVDGIDQGNNISSEAELIRTHAQGYIAAIGAGTQTIMASFNSWKGQKLHGHKYLLTDVLKNKMGFDGFVIGDWDGHGQLPGCSNSSCPDAINAGLDMFMVSKEWKPLFYNTVGQVYSGEISMDRMNDAVTRILRVKMRAGLFEAGPPSNRRHAGYARLIGHPDHRAVARQAVRESLVLLKNKDNILPLQANQKILVAGSGADNIAKQSGGWSVTWQGRETSNGDFPGGSSIYKGLKSAIEAGGGEATLSVDGNFQEKPQAAIVVFGEEPYAEMEGDVDDLYYGRRFEKDLALLKSYKAQGIPVVSVFLSGRPLWVHPEINASDAFVAAFLPGSEGAGVADVLIRKADGSVNYDFKGKLSFSWPDHARHLNNDKKPLFKTGYGLTFEDTDTLGELHENPYPRESKLKRLYKKVCNFFFRN